MKEWYHIRNEIAERRYAHFYLLEGHERLGSEIYIQYIEDNCVVWFALDMNKFNPAIFNRRIPVKLEFVGNNLDYTFTVTGLCEIVKNTNNMLSEEVGEFLVKTKLLYSVYKKTGNSNNLIQTIRQRLTSFFERGGKEHVKVLK